MGTSKPKKVANQGTMPAAQVTVDAPPPRIPGEDFDPEETISGTISKGWTFVKFSLPGCSAVVGLIVYLANSNIDPVGIRLYSQATLIWLFVAMGCSFLNALSWSTGPQADLKDLRRWVRTENEMFPINNIEERTIWLQMALVSASTLAPLFGPLIFGIIGFSIYLINFICFFRIRRKVDSGVRESLKIYDSDKYMPTEVKTELKSALGIIDEYWGTERSKHVSFDKREEQQIRHMFLLLCFIGVMALGALGRWGSGTNDYYKMMAYVVGVVALVFAVVSITVLRSIRQDKLQSVLSKLPREYRPLMSAKQTKHLGD
jgi:hypothetical protein